MAAFVLRYMTMTTGRGGAAFQLLFLRGVIFDPLIGDVFGGLARCTCD